MEAKRAIEILAKSSSGDPYTVTFYIGESSISAFCSCPAGGYRKLCKHVMRMLYGDNSILFDTKQKELLASIISHLQKTAIPALLYKLSESEILLENAKKNAKKARNTLEKVILQK